MNIESLKEAGLTEGETKVYLALLEIGSSTTGPIIEKSKVAKSIIYQLLDKLIEKGLVSYVTKEKTKYYQASDPDKLLDYIEERKKELERNAKQVEKLIPELLLKQASAKKSEVRLFEGFKGMITVHEHTYEKLKSGEEYFYLSGPAEQPEYFHAYWKKDHKRRAKAEIKSKILFHPKVDDETLRNRNSYKGSEARRMPIEINTPAWFMGYKDVAVISFPSSNPITVEIINQEIADSFRAYFEEFWKRSKPFKS
ncbi:hypothetical protein COV18_06910 [Candidatus Woesearchaeota archaeon CG10_big_fil_rev_8_21_14_0_10_37_12]|nr:MAG: hypothetical protein COV18_06910 [Candidatus Woesearchaeota archaeon CG10_big_fil_rev_8_21_14_0_10_37_12]